VSGAGTGVSTAGVSGSGVVPAGTGGAGSAGVAAAGSGGQAGGAPPVCKIPDDLAVAEGEAEDGGVPSDCQNIPRTIITNNCIGGSCHHTPNKFQASAGQLDLMTPCVADRLANAPSTTCKGLPLIDTAHVEQSFLLNKLETEQPICGQPMPLESHLSTAQRQCMHAWVDAVVRAFKR
jgi:hypothetical protein